ncbi:hypothetical protein PIB30_027182 [Stylosanthes scabra]|uniref:Uncharacterized protein n=1 Tax=Stylosanthes scabra TaxID=79078 RepID=A0ABU6RAV5_9FABA|nr:hypothetical protein [Stylosanthes scabra]
MDLQLSDINGIHVGIDLNGVISTQAADLGTLDIDLERRHRQHMDPFYPRLCRNGFPRRIFRPGVDFHRSEPVAAVMNTAVKLLQWRCKNL